MNNKEYYEQKFIVYITSLRKKHESLIKNVYKHLNLKELRQLKLTIEEGRVADLTFLRTCAECNKECYQEKDIVKCRTCTYCIHDNASCHKLNTEYRKCGSNCNDNYTSNYVEDYNNLGEINTNHRKYNADGDDISEFHNNVTRDNSEEYSKTQTVVSESCNTFANKLNRNKSSGITCNKENESLPKIIAIPNIVTITSVEPAMTTDGNTNNVNTNIVTLDDIFNDTNLTKFFFKQ